MNKRKKTDRPDYLDINQLLIDYAPLMKSVYKTFSKFNNLYTSLDDYEDLKAQIQYEFVKLCQEYNPARGVDFPGYIKFHFQQRVYHYVTKLQKTKQKELVIYSRDNDGESEDSINFENTELMADRDADIAFNRAEALACLDWNALPNKKCRRLVESILFEGKTIEQLAADEGIPVKTMRLRYYTACGSLIEYAEQKQLEHDMYIENMKSSSSDFYSAEVKRIPFVIRIPVVTRVPIVLNERKERN